ncbi:FAD/NAD(P)-binding domain-containing protein [Phlegmacium glaucopus]|nr:FAD/NAD(P)-binding domain-containing protein [Phlegmacium glaucopus]
MTSAGSGTKFKVAICGAGIGGLIVAVALSRYPDIEVEIFEAAGRLGEIGAGIGLFARPWEVIQKLDLEEELLKLTELKRTEDHVPSFQYRKSDCPEGVDFHTLFTKGHLFAFHRAEFQAALLRKIPADYRIYCSKRLRSYEQRHEGPITLLFEDGTSTSCDVLVGADGLKSAVRRSLLEEKARRAQSQNNWSEAADIRALIEPAWSGTNAYRALISADRLRSRQPNHRVLTRPMIYLGKNAHIIAYPISRGTKVNFVAFKTRPELENSKFNGSWVCPGEKSEFMNMFRGWEPDVQALLDCVEGSLRWAIHVVKPLDSFVDGNVAILGDAAHAMTPHQGAGAGQAIEDAYILSTVLGHRLTTRERITHALRIYDRIRRPFSQKAQERARLNGQCFSFNCREIDFDSIPECELIPKLDILGQIITKNWEWAWTTSLGPSSQEAIRLLESQS